jgi:hypothetical protein
MRLFEDMGKLPMMLWKGKMPLFQSAAPGRSEREAMFERASRIASPPLGGGEAGARSATGEGDKQ